MQTTPTTNRRRHAARRRLALLMVAVAATACGGGGNGEAEETAENPSAVPPASAPVAVPSPAAPSPPAAPPTAPSPAPAAGNPSGACAVPAAAQPRSIANPTTVVGSGTPASCTSAAVVAAVANGGVVTFNCGPDPVTITLAETARVFNNKPDLVLDGGGKVTLSGGGVRRILYQNTCDPALVWMSARCDLDDAPKTTLQNLVFADGNASGQHDAGNTVYGGGAVFARGGRLSIINSRFVRNRCESTGPDMGGGAVRVRDMSAASPVHVAGSTFGGAAGQGNECSNGGGLSGLAASYAVFNSVFTHNRAVGYGQNPAIAGTPGGGLGGGIYMDGNRMDLTLCGSVMNHNVANEGGSAIIYVSNDRSGTMSITDSQITNNPFGTRPTAFDDAGLGRPGLFVLAAPGQPVIRNSTITR